jgi:D-glycero-alpha-D-manno-heptose-7-phosphate kinase
VQLAEEAFNVESNILKAPVGKQDQYASAFGGVNYFEFKPDETVVITPLYISGKSHSEFLNRSILIWTGQSRNANSILSDQNSRTVENIENLIQLRELATKFKVELLSPISNYLTLGNIVRESWNLKNQLSPLITSIETQEIIEFLKENGSTGEKLLGAGGGGFVFALGESEFEKNVLNNGKWPSFLPEIDSKGSRIVALA